MLFNSLAFAIFLPIVFILYWAIPHKYRWIVLLIASYYFYMSWSPKYVLLILLTTAVSYLCAILVEKTDQRKKQKFYMITAVVVSLAVLFFFKYFNFLSESVTTLFRMIAIPVQPFTLKVMLPVGISFYTFQSLSYVIDVYKGDVKAQKNFGKYALYISFFPQLVAGPIERTENLMPQLFENRKFDHDKAVYGLRQMLLGFFKKLIIADAVSKYVDMIYNDVHSYFGLTFIFATILFTFQIYCDFSGYSDIAIGTAKLLGIDLMTNFKSPYLSKSIKEFWGRWHISLSSWFRDYVYIPLGGNRVSKGRHACNLMITFLTSGLWHGANWTYVLWGGLHGLYQIIENLFKKTSEKKTSEKKTSTEKISTEKISTEKTSTDKTFTDKTSTDKASAKNTVVINILKTVWTFALVAFAWIFFRANTISDALFVITHLHNGVIHFGNAFIKMLIDMQLTYFSFAKIVGCLVILMIYDYFSLKKDLLKEFGKVKWPIRWLFYIGLVSVIIVLKLHNGTNQEFIYFQF